MVDRELGGFDTLNLKVNHTLQAVVDRELGGFDTFSIGGVLSYIAVVDRELVRLRITGVKNFKWIRQTHHKFLILDWVVFISSAAMSILKCRAAKQSENIRRTEEINTVRLKHGGDLFDSLCSLRVRKVD